MRSVGKLETSRWIIRTNRGDEMRARFVSMANGYQAKPKLPGIPGISSFRGHAFHTSRWDYDYTGDELENLADKRVGIIGTGATAIQCVPHLAAAAQQLYVFQRTPSSVDVRANRPTDPQWAGTLQPGWQRQAHRELPDPHRRRAGRRGPGRRRLDQHHPEASGHASDTDGVVDPEQRTRDIETRRLRQDGGDPGASR